MEEVIKNVWQKSKLLVKGLVIGLLVLLLLIPAHFVQDLIMEREARQKEAVQEVSGKWAGSQNITGPILVIPYDETVMTHDGRSDTYRYNAYFLPDKLNIDSRVNPEKRYRGIYEVMLYTSEMSMKGNFSALPLSKLKIAPDKMIWQEAYVFMGITDPKGLSKELQLRWNDSMLTLNPTAVNNGVMKEGFASPVTISAADAEKGFTFSTEVFLNGSQQLLFTPVGKETTVDLASNWPDPSFTGAQLPTTPASIKDTGFVAKWKDLSHTRNFPQHWKNTSYSLTNSAFGVDLIIPVNSYQKTLRSVKYAILCILLTFTAFFLIETTNRKSVHPVQYALIGFALILFYTLLLSFSEYIGFNAAYGIAAAATVGLIGWFVKGLLGSMRLSVLLSFVLVLLYSYVFTILQLQDYALLLGSIGLFLTLAVVMYFSRRIQW